MKLHSRLIASVCVMAVASLVSASAQTASPNLLRIDATQPVPAPQPVKAQLGTARNPSGHVLGANSEHLTLDGKPWLPVMGEFHFSRYPEAEWEQEILKMKASGVQIVATYVIWLHHEETEGRFDWEGQRDLRTFVELCRKHGMYVYPRIGPWAHAEARNGGFPDWVVKAGPVRQNDPAYLARVRRFYDAIAQQLKGELWKDGGPVIGLQIENEYRQRGPGKGDEHIRKLKEMAIQAGLDVPFYTVTGWDGAAIPLDAVLPMFGGYPDAPWDESDKQLPANEVYAFRFDNRAAGNMGAIGGRGQNAASTYQGTPFLTAEVGDGIQDTYFRRPVVSADDVASIAPVMLGSGANLLGYYMFHGGRNPEGHGITLQESQATGYPTDVPVKSYDFQAPLGEFGQEEPSLRKLKLVHYFLHDFGESLATMAPRRPDRLPASPTDNSVPRVAARTAGDRGFLFVGNYVRNLTMPDRPGFQVELHLPSGAMRIPEDPIDLPSNVYGIWPVMLPLGPTTLRYAIAQPFRRVESGGQTFYFFFAQTGVSPEFLFDKSAHLQEAHGKVEQSSTPDGLRVRIHSAEAELKLAGGVHIVLLPEGEAENVWTTDDDSVLLKTAAFAVSDGAQYTLYSTGEPTFRVGVFGTNKHPVAKGAELHANGDGGVFREYTVSVPKAELRIDATQVAQAQPRNAWQFGPKPAWRKNSLPMAPDDQEFERSAVWKLKAPAVPANLADAFLQIRYQGDVARLSRNGTLLDDNFRNGVPWTIGLREIGVVSGGELNLKVLPLPTPFPMYLENTSKLRFAGGEADALDNIAIVPQYRVALRMSPSRRKH